MPDAGSRSLDKGKGKMVEDDNDIYGNGDSDKYQASETTSDSSEVPVDPEEEEIPATQSEKRRVTPQSNG